MLDIAFPGLPAPGSVAQRKSSPSTGHLGHEDYPARATFRCGGARLRVASCGSPASCNPLLPTGPLGHDLSLRSVEMHRALSYGNVDLGGATRCSARLPDAWPCAASQPTASRSTGPSGHINFQACPAVATPGIVGYGVASRRGAVRSNPRAPTGTNESSPRVEMPRIPSPGMAMRGYARCAVANQGPIGAQETNPCEDAHSRAGQCEAVPREPSRVIVLRAAAWQTVVFQGPSRAQDFAKHGFAAHGTPVPRALTGIDLIATYVNASRPMSTPALAAFRWASHCNPRAHSGIISSPGPVLNGIAGLPAETRRNAIQRVASPSGALHSNGPHGHNFGAWSRMASQPGASRVLALHPMGPHGHQYCCLAALGAARCRIPFRTEGPNGHPFTLREAALRGASPALAWLRTPRALTGIELSRWRYPSLPVAWSREAAQGLAFQGPSGAHCSQRRCRFCGFRWNGSRPIACPWCKKKQTSSHPVAMRALAPSAPVWLRGASLRNPTQGPSRAIDLLDHASSRVATLRLASYGEVFRGPCLASRPIPSHPEGPSGHKTSSGTVTLADARHRPATQSTGPSGHHELNNALLRSATQSCARPRFAWQGWALQSKGPSGHEFTGRRGATLRDPTPGASSPGSPFQRPLGASPTHGVAGRRFASRRVVRRRSASHCQASHGGPRLCAVNHSKGPLGHQEAS